MKVALLGCGWIAGWGHARAIPRVPSWEVVAVADTVLAQAQDVGGQLGLDPEQCFDSLDALLAIDDLELVCVLTPPSLHREQVEAIVQTGRHVACEKPFALTLADADAMLEAANAANVVVSVFHNHVYYDEHQLGYKLVQDGAIGEVEGVVINGLGARPWSGAQGWKPEWRRKPTLGGGGALMDSGIHGLYLSEFYFGTSPSWVSATTSPSLSKDSVETYAYVQLGFPNGIAAVGSGWGGGPGQIEIFGQEGRISMEFDVTEGAFGGQPKATRVVSNGQLISEHHVQDRDSHLFLPGIYEAIEGRVHNADSGFSISGEQGREAIELVLAAYASSVRGEKVPLPIRRSDPIYDLGLLGLFD